MFDGDKNLIEKSGNYLELMRCGASEGSEDEPGLARSGLCLDDYLTLPQIAELFRYRDQERVDMEESKLGDTFKAGEFSAEVYIKGNVMKPKKIIVNEITYEVNHVQKGKNEKGEDKISSVSYNEIASDFVKTFDLHPEGIDGLEEENFVRTHLYGPIPAGNMDLDDAEDFRITEKTLAKRALCDDVLNPEILDNLDEEAGIHLWTFGEKESLWQVKTTSIHAFQSEDIAALAQGTIPDPSKKYYAVVQSVFNPWPTAARDLAPIYLMTFLLLLAIGILLSRKLWDIYRKQELLETGRRLDSAFGGGQSKQTRKNRIRQICENLRR